MSDPILAWHFVTENRTLRDGQKVRAGRVYRLPKGSQPVLCKVGYHGSVRALDALQYAPGPIVCRVELRGTIVEDTDKLVASERKVLWVADATKTLRLFALAAAEGALKAERKRGREPDKRSWDAIRVTRNWLMGKASDEERFAAHSAADSAAHSAHSAAHSAA